MFKKIASVILALTMLACFGTSAMAKGVVRGKATESGFDGSQVVLGNDDEILLQAGMPQEEINSLDADIKEFIVNDLKASGEIEDIAYVTAEDVYTPAPRVNQVLTGISFTVSSFKSSNTVYIYPTYEFTTNKKPTGNDSFSLLFGDALMPLDYGGQIWYKDNTMSDWAAGDSMTANTGSFIGAEYSGYQLGTPDWSMKIKGCAYAHAEVGSGTDKRIMMSYMHNPNSVSYDLTFGYGSFGITYSSPNTIYTAFKKQILSY